MPPRWFIRNTSTGPLTGRQPPSGGYQTSVGHVTEMLGHAPEFGGHDAETGGHAPPKYATAVHRVLRDALRRHAKWPVYADSGWPDYADSRHAAG